MAEIIVALDYPKAAEAMSLVDRLGNEAGFYKVGLELFTREGPQILTSLGEQGKRVFLDLKLHDIPNTVASAVRVAAGFGVELLTLHIGGGESMLRAAAEVAASAPSSPRLLGVTVLTSLHVTELEGAWGREIISLRDEVLRLADLAHACGLRGLVASPHEAEDLRRRFGPETLIVTPGIRPAGTDAHDQNRIATPQAAAQAGADLLVVGRAITRAADPLAAFRSISAEARGSSGRTPEAG